MYQCRFTGGSISTPRWSQTHYARLGMSIEAPRPENCNSGSRKTWIDTSYCGTVLGIKKDDKNKQS